MFGAGGAVNLREGLGDIPPGITFPSSPPTIVNGTAMISGWVTDGLHTGEPSGGVRAYDAVTGRLRWVWDIARPADRPLAPGETYTPGTPNAWGVFSGDPALGLVYFGTGVTTPDYFGAHRTPEQEKYATAIVALDVATGQVRWSFQTVHHDIWDYDIGSQPVLADLPVGGRTVPALIGPTKRGQFFVLDRRTGAPLYPVTERPVPQDAAPGETPAATQPYSAFPDVGGGRLSEAGMWGATPLDQLWCRIRFRKARYAGDFTPPGTDRTIFYPGSAGGSNWGSVTIDPVRGLMIANTLYMADIGRLIPRAEADRIAAAYGEGSKAAAFAFPQQGTPYAMDRTVFLGPLGAPCQQPPYGRLHAFDLRTGRLVWSRPLGTARRAGPLGLESRLPVTMGVPNLGGSIATAGGLVFIGAAQDRMIRAIDIGNGRELWRHPLPAIGAATPMTYRAPGGRQFVVIAAGGHPGLPGPAGGSVMAFALPRR
jgi:membrane-bound PQQ-dependent dehydrogenase (glucose/quinate/shikimate family)